MSKVVSKRCPKCKKTLPASAFTRNSMRSNGLEDYCKECKRTLTEAIRDKAKVKADAENLKIIQDAEDRARRVASDLEPLKLGDLDDEYDVSVGNVKGAGKLSARASSQKRQEFNKSMGDNAEALRQAAVKSSKGQGSVLDNMPASAGKYISGLAEQERRFGNRRVARSISLAQAHEALALKHFAIVAEQCFSKKVVPTGYAKAPKKADAKRSVVCLLSDLHLGSDLSSLDEPMPFRAVEEARRLEFIMRQVIDYKPQYRKNSEFLLLLNGDLIEGLLMHDAVSGAPLTEQKAIFWHLMSRFIGELSRAFPSGRIRCEPGNHGRNIVRHPGRATSRKWDGHEWEMYYALRMMCSELKNIEWTISFRAVDPIPLHGSILGLTHGDTEVKIGHPDKAAESNARALDRINATRLHGVEFDAWAFGHFHTPRYHPGHPKVVYNGALVPPNGYARANGHIGEPQGQFLWEAVAGFPIGDLRFIEVNRSHDEDERLGTILTPFRFPTE